MGSQVLPILAACHHRRLKVQHRSYIYTYGLLAFPGQRSTQQRGFFCLAAQRSEVHDGRGDSEAVGPDKVKRYSVEKRADNLLSLSDVFQTSSKTAMMLFEKIAFADDPVSPLHLADVVSDLVVSLSPALITVQELSSRSEGFDKLAAGKADAVAEEGARQSWLPNKKGNAELTR